MKMRLWHLIIVVFCFFVFSSSALADNLNQTINFNIDSHYDANGRTSLTATLRYSSTRAYAYIENNFWNRLNLSAQTSILSRIGNIMSEFDNRIYPIETQTFGSEPNPGVDGDPKISILFTPLIENAGGYFNTGDCYPAGKENPNSNAREMFYLNTNSITDETKIKNFLAHEFQHLISFNNKELLKKISDDTWLNEARSEYAISLLGYNNPFIGSNLEKRLQIFQANPSDSLTEWKNLSTDYGQIAMFGEYLTEHWLLTLLTDSLQSGEVGIPSLNYALAKDGFTESFTAIFRDWMIANFLNNAAIDSKYGYSLPELKNFKIPATKTFLNLGDNSAFVASDAMKDWQARWYDIDNFTAGNKTVLKIYFDSPSITSFQVSYLVFKTDGTMETKIFEPDFQNSSLFVSGIGTDISRVVLMPFKKDKLSGFGDNETVVNLSFTMERVADAPTPTPTPAPITSVKPADFGLREGDFIRATGDIDIYIINDYGYKRLILNPAICLMYGHLGARGCFSAVKTVAPTTRDAFKTSWYFTNGETKDGKVYRLEPTGEDTATLYWLNISGANFLTEGGDFNSVFQINSNEQRSYSTGSILLKI